MSTVGEVILQHNVLELTEQLYESYTRIKALGHEIAEMQATIEDQQKVIDGLATSLSEN